MQFEKFLYREHMKSLAVENSNRELGRFLFVQIRDRYAANLCGYIRVLNDAERAGIKLPEPYRSVDWCNAAAHILTAADEIIQDQFIRADPRTKDRMVDAVIEDGGLVTLAGFFSELPLC